MSLLLYRDGISFWHQGRNSGCGVPMDAHANVPRRTVDAASLFLAFLSTVLILFAVLLRALPSRCLVRRCIALWGVLVGWLRSLLSRLGDLLVRLASLLSLDRTILCGRYGDREFLIVLFHDRFARLIAVAGA